MQKLSIYQVKFNSAGNANKYQWVNSWSFEVFNFNKSTSSTLKVKIYFRTICIIQNGITRKILNLKSDWSFRKTGSNESISSWCHLNFAYFMHVTWMLITFLCTNLHAMAKCSYSCYSLRSYQANAINSASSTSVAFN